MLIVLCRDLVELFHCCSSFLLVKITSLLNSLTKLLLLVKSEPMDVDMVDSDKAVLVETLKKPVKQVPVKKEVIDEMTLSNLLSATSMVWM